MSKIKFKVFEAFAGIGTQHMALKKLGVDFEIVGISEIDEYAIQAYNAIHGVHKNFGDISKINPEEIPDFNLMTYSFPCNDISLSGRLDGFSEGKNKRSSLLWNALDIVEAKNPDYLIAENVGNILSARFKKEYDAWMKRLSDLGYNTYVKNINAREYGYAPQNRGRVFAVSIKRELDKGIFKFAEKKKLQNNLLDLLEDNVEDFYYLEDYVLESLLLPHDDKNTLKIRNATKTGFLIASHGDGVDFQFYNSMTRRGRVQPQSAHTLNTKPNLAVALMENGQMKLRKFTARESCRLMNISDEDFDKAVKSGLSQTTMYRLAGNAIVVDLIKDIFKSLHNAVS